MEAVGVPTSQSPRDVHPGIVGTGAISSPPWRSARRWCRFRPAPDGCQPLDSDRTWGRAVMVGRVDVGAVCHSYSDHPAVVSIDTIAPTHTARSTLATILSSRSGATSRRALRPPGRQNRPPLRRCDKRRLGRTARGCRERPVVIGDDVGDLGYRSVALDERST